MDATSKSYSEKRGEVLVAIMNNPFDFELLIKKRWYRIPVISVEKWLAKRWPPNWLAFYMTNIFGNMAHSVIYYAEVIEIEKIRRIDLFPNESKNDRSARYYFKLTVSSLKKLPFPIYSRRFRRIVFIPTTWDKFHSAVEVNDLYDESKLEDRLWAELKRHDIPAERQEFVTARGNEYALDFAIYCNEGKLDVEADGDTWHANPQRAAQDNLRDNDLKTAGWQVLRFNGDQIREKAGDYCLPIITENINVYKGLEDGKKVINSQDDDIGGYQQFLFDDI